MHTLTSDLHFSMHIKHNVEEPYVLHVCCVVFVFGECTVNDLFSASALVTAPYLISKQYTWQLLVGERVDSDSAHSRLVIKGY